MIERDAPGALPGHGGALPDRRADLPSDGDLDVCACAHCRALDVATPRIVRGPVQDESGRLDPLDRVAMQAIEGHRPDLTLIRADQRCDRGRR